MKANLDYFYGTSYMHKFITLINLGGSLMCHEVVVAFKMLVLYLSVIRPGD